MLDSGTNAKGVAVTLNVNSMLSIHAVFRSRLPELPDLVRAAAAAPERGAVADYATLLYDLLVEHHRSEDAVLWPVLRTNDPGDDAEWARMLTEHQAIDHEMPTLTKLVAEWREEGTGEADLCAQLRTLSSDTIAHLDDEEGTALPIMQRCLTQAQFDELGAHSRASVTPQQLAMALSMIVLDAPADVSATVLHSLPDDVRTKLHEEWLPECRQMLAQLPRTGA